MFEASSPMRSLKVEGRKARSKVRIYFSNMLHNIHPSNINIILRYFCVSTVLGCTCYGR